NRPGPSGVESGFEFLTAAQIAGIRTIQDYVGGATAAKNFLEVGYVQTALIKIAARHYCDVDIRTVDSRRIEWVDVVNRRIIRRPQPVHPIREINLRRLARNILGGNLLT